MLKLKNIIITLFLSVGFLLIGIVNVSAAPSFEPDYQSLFYSLDNFPYNTYYHIGSVAVLYDTNTETYYAIGSHQSFPNFLTALDKTPVGNQAFSYYSNFYGFGNFYNSYIDLSSNTTPVFGLYYDKVNEEWTDCNGCWGRISNTYYAYGLFRVYYSGSTSLVWANLNDVDEILFYEGYNLDYYASVMDYFDTTSSYTYFTTPSLVVGSHGNFSSYELESTTLDLDKLYINHHMYKFDDTSSEYKMIGAKFNYDSTDNTFYDNNYELGFILTYKTIVSDNTPSIIVNAKTKTGQYSCSVTPVRSGYDDIYYQHYVYCPSVALTSANDEFLDIIVKGENDITNYQGPYLRYDTNYLFHSDLSYVGISQVLKRVTNVSPTPLPDEGGDSEVDDELINGINGIADSINSGALPDNLDELVDFAGYLPPGPVDSILTMPLTFMNNYYSAFTSSSCNAINVPFPYIENKYFVIPCGNTLINSMGLINWWETIGAVFGGYCLYKYLVNLYKWVDGVLTFRENNMPDWGGA